MPTLLIEGDAFVKQFGEDCVTNPERIALSERVSVVEDPAITSLGSKFRHKVSVDVLLKDGTKLTETREAPEGSEQSFASTETIVSKFFKLAGSVMSTSQQEQIVDTVLNLERLSNAADLTRLMCLR